MTHVSLSYARAPEALDEFVSSTMSLGWIDITQRHAAAIPPLSLSKRKFVRSSIPSKNRHHSRAAPSSSFFWAVGRRMSNILGCAPRRLRQPLLVEGDSDGQLHSPGRRQLELLVSISACNNFLADRCNGPAFAGGNHPRRQLRIERCGIRGRQRLDLADIPDAQFGPSKIGRMRSAVAADRVRY